MRDNADESEDGIPTVIWLDDEEWEWFQNMLNEPPKDLPNLRKLMTEHPQIDEIDQ